MPKFTLMCEHLSPMNDSVESKHVVEFNKESLNDVLEQFEFFLRGSGFYFNGNLDFVDDVNVQIDEPSDFPFDMDHEAGPTLTVADMDSTNETILHFRV